MKEFYRPERMVLAGVGIDHQQLIDLGKKYFSVPKSTEPNEPTSTLNKAIWTGGSVLVRATHIDRIQVNLSRLFV